jgi:hypothetical protein
MKKQMIDKPCKNCGSYGGNAGCDVCGPPIRQREAEERLARAACSAFSKLPTSAESMIDELKESLAAHPENPFLQGHVSALENMPNCRNCAHCGSDAGKHPVSGTALIRCDHPSVRDEDEETRTIDPSFGEICADYFAAEK